jgi:hypothetical protein
LTSEESGNSRLSILVELPELCTTDKSRGCHKYQITIKNTLAAYALRQGIEKFFIPPITMKLKSQIVPASSAVEIE